MSKKISIIYLAAGLGSRLKKKTKNLPKCLVPVNGISLIEYNFKFFEKFKNINIVSGYKSEALKKKLKNKKYNIYINKFYKSTNMVFSTFIPKIKKNDVIICYGDIIFNYKIYQNLLRNNYDFIPIYKNWLDLWKKRMLKSKIKSDAENLILKNKIIREIGGNIDGQFPKYQFMGIIKLKNKTYRKLKKFFIERCKKNIDFTSFLNEAIKKKILVIKGIPTNKFWYEIDTMNDLKVAENELRKIRSDYFF
tara:strand:- start:953 stop:1702 length:750 start_codon:yes stop_codon:yes gene_type:complete